MKIKIFFFLNISIFLSFVSNKCSQGCLKCNVADQCQICDVFNNYKLLDFKCFKVELENCEILNSDGSCLQCTQGYIFDPNTKHCITPQLDQTIKNCLRYSSIQSCQLCQEGYYLNKGGCLIPEKIIKNCKYYSTKENCLQCIKNFVINEEQTECVFLEVDPTCLSQTYFYCNECDQNYYKNPNKIIFDSLSIDKVFDIESIQWNVIDQIIKNKQDDVYYDVCAKIEVEHCKVLQQFNQCLSCNEGYFLDNNNKCQSNPIDKINKCLKYKSKNVCQNCEQKYYLKSFTNCVAIIEIDHCLLYQTGLSDQTFCQECETGYFIQNNKCVQRTNIIKDCEYLSKISNVCSQCQSGYVLTSDHLHCLPEQINCVEYHTIDKKLECKKCKEMYYYDSTNKSCKIGKIKFCSSYYLNGEQCSECQFGYYLHNKSCLKHDNISHCSKYDQNEPNLCLNCENKFMQVEHNNYCRRVETIKEGCLEYKDMNNCQKCETEYFLNAQNICELIDPTSNCLEYSVQEGCTKCSKEFILNNKHCKPPLNIQLLNCFLTTTNGLLDYQQIECSICQQNSLPYDHSNQFYCVEQERIDSLSNTPILQCDKFAYQSSQLVCKQCSQGYHLLSNSCIQGNCANTLFPYIIDALTQTIDEINLCKFIAHGCVVGGYSSRNLVDQECHYCDESNYITLLKNWNDINEIYITYKNYNLQQNNLSLSPVSFFPRIDCVPKSSDNLINNQTVQYCEYYSTISSSSKFGCVKCKNGFTGQLSTNSDGSFISNCAQMITCNQIQLQGLSQHLQRVVSCSQCLNQNEIPFVFFKGGSIYVEIDELSTYDSNYDIAGSGGLSNKCLPATAFSLKQSQLSFPSNCVIGLYNLSGSKDSSDSSKISNIDKSKISVFCGACQAGFRIVKGFDEFNLPIKDYVGKCEEILNCKFSQWLNYCSECKIGYVWGYDNTIGILYDQCKQYGDVNCLSADNNEQNGGKCKICKNGYFLSKDNQCLQIQMHKCHKFVPPLSFETKHLSIIDFNYFQSSGCQNCENGFKIFYQQNFVDSVCVQTNKFAFIVSSVEYIQNCVQYFNSLLLKCFKCADGFTVDQTQKICLPIQYSKCLQIDSLSQKCIKCENGFVIVKGICEIQNIPNCLLYSTITNSSIQICEDCEEGFFLKDKICVEGKVQNCQNYSNSENNCIKCKDHYILGSNKDGKRFCIYNNQTFNCKQYDQLELNRLTCLTCDQDYILTTEVQFIQKSSCLEIGNIPQCQLYSSNSYLHQSTFGCEKCEEDFYLTNNECQKRTIQKDFCKKFSKLQNTCEDCEDTYYVNEEGYCEKNPTGIQYCSSYKNSNECIICIHGYYLHDNICHEVQSQIEHCLTYRSENNCLECQSGYYQEVGQCIKAKAVNCASYVSQNECRTCFDNFGLKLENLILSCVAKLLPDKCIESTDHFPFICTKCLNDFYLSDQNECKQIESPILHCEQYQNQLSCEKCKKGFVLVDNGKKCSVVEDFAVLGSNHCQSLYFLNEPVCSMCIKGYYFLGNDCVKCQSENCAICNPEDQTKCLLCDQGNFMNKEFKCEQVEAINNSDTKESIQFANKAEGLTLWCIENKFEVLLTRVQMKKLQNMLPVGFSLEVSNKNTRRNISKSSLFGRNIQNKRKQIPSDEINYKRCLKIISALKKHEYSDLFINPVDPTALGIPHYFDIIKQPMDLTTVEYKLKNGDYLTKEQFEQDVNQIWQNAIIFNPPGDEIYKMAQILKDYFAQLLKSNRFELMKKDKKQSRKKLILDKPLTFNEQKVLSEKINQLPPDYLWGVYNIVSDGQNQSPREDYEFNIGTLPPKKQRELETYVISKLNEIGSIKKSSTYKTKQQQKRKQAPQPLKETVNNVQYDHFKPSLPVVNQIEENQLKSKPINPVSSNSSFISDLESDNQFF